MGQLSTSGQFGPAVIVVQQFCGCTGPELEILAAVLWLWAA